MFNKINILIKTLISITLISYIFLFDYDYKIPLLSLSLAYFIGSVILNPLLQNNFWKFFVYILDIAMLTYFSYATGNIYFSLFFYLLLIPEINLKQLLLIILLSIPMVLYNYYQTNFYDFIYISLVIGLNFFILKNVFYSKSLEDEKLKNIYITQESFINFLKCKSKLEFYKKFYELSTTLNLFKRDKISPEIFSKFMYENLNVDTIIIYDIDQNKCYKFGNDLDCDKALNIIKDEKLYVNENANAELGYKYIISKRINNIYLILFYKDYILDEEEIINLIMQ